MGIEFIDDALPDSEPVDMTIADVSLRGIYEGSESGSAFTEEYKAQRERDSGGEEPSEPPAAELELTAWATDDEWESLNALRERSDPFPVSVGPFAFEEMGIANLERNFTGKYHEANEITIRLQEFREYVVQQRSAGSTGGGSSGGGGGSAPDQMSGGGGGGGGGGTGGTPGAPEPMNPEYSGTPNEVPSGGRASLNVGPGETAGGELYNVANGGFVDIGVTGGTLENVGISGETRGNSGTGGNGEPVIGLSSNHSGSSLLRNIYMGDGSTWQQMRDTGIFIHKDASGSTTLEHMNVQNYPDNGIYGSAPHESGPGNMNIQFRDSYTARNGTSGFRMGQGTMVNCHSESPASHGGRAVWARSPGVVELQGCQIDGGNVVGVMLGNGGSTTVNATDGTNVAGSPAVGRDGGGDINYSGGASEGGASPQAPSGVPGSAADAANGGGGGGGGDGEEEEEGDAESQSGPYFTAHPQNTPYYDEIWRR